MIAAMARTNPGTATRGAPARRGRGGPDGGSAARTLLAVGGALVVLAVVAFLTLGRGEAGPLVGTPVTPRPATLSPDLFGGKTAAAYAAAREVPQVLERIGCACGCMDRPGHRNNLECFADDHGAG